MDGAAEFFTFVIGAFLGLVAGAVLSGLLVINPMQANYGEQYCAPLCGEGQYEVKYDAQKKPKHFGCVCYLNVNDGEKVEDAVKRKMETK